jgi:hypothetical protein
LRTVFFAEYRFVALKNCCISGAKWVNSAGWQNVSCLFWQVVFGLFDVTSFFSNVWEEKGGGVGMWEGWYRPGASLTC